MSPASVSTAGWPRLLACDLDGTLLGPDGHVPARTAAAVRALRAAGVTVVLASGRLGHAMRRLCLELGLDGPQITMQGAVIASPVTGEIIHAWRLSADQVREHLSFARSTGAIPLLCFPDGFRAEFVTPEIAAMFMPYEEPLPEIVPNLAVFADEEPVKTYLYTPPGTHDRIWDAAHVAFAGRATVTSGDERSIELLPVGVNKGEALRVLVASLGIPLAEVATIGDARNDIEMLRISGRSAAMAHARPEVRNVAELVVPTNRDEGALEAILAFFPGLLLSDGADQVARPRVSAAGGRGDRTTGRG